MTLKTYERGQVTFKVSIKSVTFSDSTEVQVPEGGILVIVGPNSAGKSRSLRDIRDGIAGQTSGAAVSSIKLELDGSSIELLQYLAGLGLELTGHMDQMLWTNMNVQDYVAAWGRGQLANMSNYFTTFLEGTNRLNLLLDAQAVDPGVPGSAINPVQRAALDRSIQDALDYVVRRAFGLRATVDTNAGQTFRFLLGEKPAWEGFEGLPTREYLRKLRRGRPGNEAGDGINAFTGIMLTVLADIKKFIIIDEPEAFLHPPQARFLANQLAKGLSGDRQAIIATHSSDVVLGILEASVPATIVRLMRQREINSATVLEPSVVQALWDDSLLRYSNVIDGIFHDSVIVCEGEIDCRFYAAVMDDIMQEREEKQSADSDNPGLVNRRPDILYTSSNGKGRVGAVLKALAPLGVPVFAIPDFDVLREDKDLAPILAALEVNAVALESDLRAVREDLQGDSIKKRDEYRKEIYDILRTVSNHPSDHDLENLKKVFTGKTRWEDAKHLGKHFLAGETQLAAESVLALLKEKQLFVVPTGDLESWVNVGSARIKGVRWFEKVVEQNRLLDRTSLNRPLREFLGELLDMIEQRSRQDLL